MGKANLMVNKIRIELNFKKARIGVRFFFFLCVDMRAGRFFFFKKVQRRLAVGEFRKKTFFVLFLGRLSHTYSSPFIFVPFRKKILCYVDLQQLRNLFTWSWAVGSLLGSALSLSSIDLLPLYCLFRRLWLKCTHIFIMNIKNVTIGWKLLCFLFMQSSCVQNKTTYIIKKKTVKCKQSLRGLECACRPYSFRSLSGKFDVWKKSSPPGLRCLIF